MPTLTLRKRKPKKAPNPNPAASADTVAVTPVKPRPKPRPKRAAAAVPLNGEAMGMAQVAPRLRDDENVKFESRIAAETLASMKHTLPNPEPQGDNVNVIHEDHNSDLEIVDVGIGYGELPWNSISDKEEDSEEEDSEGEEEVDELINDSSDDARALEEHGEITFHPSPGPYNIIHCKFPYRYLTSNGIPGATQGYYSG